MAVFKVVMVPPRAFHTCQNANIMDPSTHGLYQGLYAWHVLQNFKQRD